VLSSVNPTASLALLAEVRGYDRILTPELPNRMLAVTGDLPASGFPLDNQPPSVPSPMYMRSDSEGQPPNEDQL